MAITLPTTPGPLSARVRMIDFGGDLIPSLGGAVQRISRLGSRHVVEIALPPMSHDDARPWIQKLKRGKFDRVVMAFPQLDFAAGSPGTAAIASAATGGTSISVKNITTPYTVKEGQFLTITHSSRRYLYSVDSDATVAVSGEVIQNQANTTVASLGSGEYSVTKTGGSGSALDASAVSATAISGDFTLRVQASQTNRDFHVGTSTTPTASNSNGDFTHMLSFNGSAQVRVYQGTTLVAGPQAYTSTQYWFIRRVGTTITVLYGATTDVNAATLYWTYAAASSATLYFDSSIFQSAAAFKVKFESAAASATTLAITPMLRTAVSVNDVVELAPPYIEGYLEGGEVSWDLETALTVGLSFTIVEAE